MRKGRILGKIIEIICLGCGKSFKLPEYINAKSYDGEVRCTECFSLLYIKLVDSKVLKYKMARQQNPPELTADDMDRANQRLKEKVIEKLRIQGKPISEEEILRQIHFGEP